MSQQHQGRTEEPSERLRLWTVQAAAVLETLEREGVLRADPARADVDLRPAYEWMAARLAEKVPPPPGCTLPLWAWLRWDGLARPRPDLRAAGHLPPGTRGVRIAFEMPVKKVLVSDFDAWHAVLNGVPYVPEEADYEAVMRRFEHLQGEERRAFLEETWRGIFPAPPWPDDLSLQAVFWELPKACIREITPFVAR